MEPMKTTADFDSFDDWFEYVAPKDLYGNSMNHWRRMKDLTKLVWDQRYIQGYHACNRMEGMPF